MSTPPQQPPGPAWGSQPPSGPAWGSQQPPSGPAWGSQQPPAPAWGPGLAAPAPPRSRTRRTWIALVAVAVVLVVGAVVLVAAPWKQKKIVFPETIGPLRSASWTPPMAWGGAYNAVYQGLFPSSSRWQSFADATDEDRWSPQRPILVIGAVLDSPNPASRVNEILAVLQSSAVLRLSLTDIHPVSPVPGATWTAAQCGQQIGDIPSDPPGIGGGGPFSQIVVCAWANPKQAGAAYFLDRDMGASEELLRMIQPTGTVVRF